MAGFIQISRHPGELVDHGAYATMLLSFDFRRINIVETKQQNLKAIGGLRHDARIEAAIDRFYFM